MHSRGAIHDRNLIVAGNLHLGNIFYPLLRAFTTVSGDEFLVGLLAYFIFRPQAATLVACVDVARIFPHLYRSLLCCLLSFNLQQSDAPLLSHFRHILLSVLNQNLVEHRKPNSQTISYRSLCMHYVERVAVLEHEVLAHEVQIHSSQCSRSVRKQGADCVVTFLVKRFLSSVACMSP